MHSINWGYIIKKLKRKIIIIATLCKFLGINIVSSANCNGDEIGCATGDTCLSFSSLCNGYEGCIDGSDEDEDFCEVS